MWYWRARKVKNGPFIPVRSWHGAPIIDGEEHDRHHRWQCMVRLETTSRAILLGDNMPIEVEGVFLRNIEPAKTGFPPDSPEAKAEYEYMVQYAAWATAHAPWKPEAQPDTPIDHAKSEIPF